MAGVWMPNNHNKQNNQRSFSSRNRRFNSNFDGDDEMNVSSLPDGVKHYKKLYEDAKVEIAMLKDNIHNQKKAHQTAHSKLQKLRNEHSRVNLEYSKKDKECNQLNKELNKQKSKIETLNQEIEEIRQKKNLNLPFSDNRNQFSDYDMDQIQRYIASLEDNNKELVNRLQKRNESIETEENKKLRAQAENLSQSYNSAESRAVHYEKMVFMLKDEDSRNQKTIKELYQTIENYKKEYKSVCEQLESEKTKHSKSLKLNSDIRKEFEDRISIKKEVMDHKMEEMNSEREKLETRIQKMQNTSFSPQNDVFLPFNEYNKPDSATQNYFMSHLKRLIDEYSCDNEVIECVAHDTQFVTNFNKAQSICYIYPRMALYVLEDEVLKEKRGQMNRSNIRFDVSNRSFCVVESHWDIIIREYKQMLTQMPQFLMLICREHSKDAFLDDHQVLFVLDLESRAVLRYDPTTNNALNDSYHKIYQKTFTNFPQFNIWKHSHLEKQYNQLSWLYCVEFARRFAVKAKASQGLQWLRKFVLKGSHGNDAYFMKIDLSQIHLDKED